jgi:hypothetical protein
VRNALVLVSAVVLLPMVALGVSSRSVFHFLRLLSPLALLFSARAADYLFSPATFWASHFVVLALAGFLLMRASARLRRSARDEEEVKIPKPPTRPGDEEDLVGLGRWRPFFTETDPMEWLAYRQYGVSIRIWATAVLALAFSGLVFLAYQPTSNRRMASSWILAWPLGAGAALIGGAVVAWLASGFFAVMRRSGELELVLNTPVGANTIVAAQWLVLKRLFFWPVLGLQAALLLPVLGTQAAMGRSAALGWTIPNLISLALGFANSALGVRSLCWVGMWFGLKARSQAGAILWTVALAKAIPWLASLLSTLAIQFMILRPISTGPTISWRVSTTHLPAFAFLSLPQLAILLYFLWLTRRAQAALPLELAGIETPGAWWPFPLADKPDE